MRKPTVLGSVLYALAMAHVAIGTALFLLVFGPFMWLADTIIRSWKDEA